MKNFEQVITLFNLFLPKQISRLDWAGLDLHNANETNFEF